MRGLILRVAVFGALGWLVELAYTTAIGRPKRPSAWMLPIYGAAGIAFPPLHAWLRSASLLARAAAYGVAIGAGEYAIGRGLRAAFGVAPWTYAGKRWSVGDVTRLDYLPLWSLFGLMLERVDDAVPSMATPLHGGRSCARRRRSWRPSARRSGSTI